MKKFWDNPDGASQAPGFAGEGARATRVPASLQIGSVVISPATVLAPMAGVTDTVFRRFIRNLGGCGLIMTEFTSADGVLRAKDQKAKRYLHFYEDEHPISAQLFGSDPQVMADAARIVEDLGFDLVDLNLGCPAKKVVKCNGGSGLLRDLPRIGGIFEAVKHLAAKTGEYLEDEAHFAGMRSTMPRSMYWPPRVWRQWTAMLFLPGFSALRPAPVSGSSS